jgi:hypothetical protein
MIIVNHNLLLYSWLNSLDSHKFNNSKIEPDNQLEKCKLNKQV